jgi:hypothetical protein
MHRSVLPIVLLAGLSIVAASTQALALDFIDVSQEDASPEAPVDGQWPPSVEEGLSGPVGETAPTPVLEARSETTAASEAEPGAPDCEGCGAINTMYWTNFGAFEDVGVKRTQNLADEIINRQEVHVALISSPQNQCFDGALRFRDGTGNVFNAEDTRRIATGKSWRAWSDRWTQASGHNWHEQGVHWFVNEKNDRCVQF